MLSLSAYSPELLDAVTGQPVTLRVRDHRTVAAIGKAPRVVERRGPGFGSTEFVYDEESLIAR